MSDHFDLDHHLVGLIAMAGHVSDVVPVGWLMGDLADCDRAFGFNHGTVMIDS